MFPLIPRRWVGLLAALVGLVLAGTASTPATGLPAWQDTNTSWSHPAAVNPKVVGLRYAAHPTYDRVVIDISGRIPSGSLTYRRHFVYDGSGDEVAQDAVRVSTELLSWAPTLTRSPLQVLARLHTVAAARSLPDAQLGRPRDADSAARLRAVSEVLAAISESAENKAGLAAVIGNGFEYVPFHG